MNTVEIANIEACHGIGVEGTSNTEVMMNEGMQHTPQVAHIDPTATGAMIAD